MLIDRSSFICVVQVEEYKEVTLLSLKCIDLHACLSTLLFVLLARRFDVLPASLHAF